MKQRFLVVQDFRSPVFMITGMAHKPHDIRFRPYRKGQTLEGQIIYTNGQPSYIMSENKYIIPLHAVQEIKTVQDVVSNATGDEKKQLDKALKKPAGNLEYIDWAIAGAIIGFAAVYFAEKKAWLKPDPKHKFIGMGIGALLFAYGKYRIAPAKQGKVEQKPATQAKK